MLRFAANTIGALLLTLSCFAAPKPGAMRLAGVAFTEVSFSDEFWSARIETNRVVTIPHLLTELEKQGSLGGFRFLAGEKSNPYRGYMWGDSDVYKTVEGMVASLSLKPDAALAQRVEKIIDSIAGAQDTDGYLFPYLQIQEPKYPRFSEEATRTCESYSIGHLIESAVLHRRVTGRAHYLGVAEKAAELLLRTHQQGESLQVSGHPEIELALITLYRETGDPKWLDFAASLVANARRIQTAWSQGRPPLSGNDAHGHAVAMLYLYSAATEIAQIREDSSLTDFLQARWNNIIGCKLYLTGGLGHSRHSEGFAPDYDLPNDVAYCETCAAIANTFWQQRLFLTSGSSAYIDVLERSLYNNVLAGVSRSGDRFFYVNPLSADGRRKFNQGLAERFSWTGCPCCPVNLVRFLPRVGDYFYASAGNVAYVNLYASSQARIRLSSGDLVIRQRTGYPWDGRVRLEVLSGPPQPVDLRLRIPGWAMGHPVPGDLYRYLDAPCKPVRIRLNGKHQPIALQDGYAVLRRNWQAGDRIVLDLPMLVRRVLAHEKVKEDRGLVAVERGPVVFCVEGVDHGGKVSDLELPDEMALEVSFHRGLLGGIPVLAGQATKNAARASTAGESVRLTLLPYFVWNHRGSGPMMVWLPRSPGQAPNSVRSRSPFTPSSGKAAAVP